MSQPASTVTYPGRSELPQGVSSFSGYFNLVSNALNSFSLFNLFDEALSDLLGEKTYYHATSARNYYSILFTGGDPKRGGRPHTGMAAAHAFFGGLEKGAPGEFTVINNDNQCCVGVGLLSTFLSVAASTGELNYPKQFGKGDSWGWEDLGKLITGIFLSICTPTLKFRFTPDENRSQSFSAAVLTNGHARMSNDQYSSTRKLITPDHIGLYGTVAHGFQEGIEAVKERADADPERFMMGVIKLVAAVALTALAVYALWYTATLGAIVKAVLMYETAVCIARIVVPLLFGLLCPSQDLLTAAAALPIPTEPREGKVASAGGVAGDWGDLDLPELPPGALAMGAAMRRAGQIPLGRLGAGAHVQEPDDFYTQAAQAGAFPGVPDAIGIAAYDPVTGEMEIGVFGGLPPGYAAAAAGPSAPRSPRVTIEDVTDQTS